MLINAAEHNARAELGGSPRAGPGIAEVRNEKAAEPEALPGQPQPAGQESVPNHRTQSASQSPMNQEERKATQ